jgi:hypothetical protein
MVEIPFDSFFKNLETVEEDSSQPSPEKASSVKKEIPSAPRVNGANMTISLDGLQSSIDPSNLFSRAYENIKAYQAHAAAAVNHTPANGHNSAPQTAHAHCPTCGRSISDPLMVSGYSDISPNSSPLVIPMGPLAAAAFESGMSAVEELKLLKAQVQDVARVCNAVARGDLSQKITVPVQGVVMVQLKDVINTMVCSFICSSIFRLEDKITRWTNWVNSQRKSLVYLKKSELKGKLYSRFLSDLDTLLIVTEQKTRWTSSGSRRRGHMARTDRSSQQIGRKSNISSSIYSESDQGCRTGGSQ